VRHYVLRLAPIIASLVAALLANDASAQTYPTRPIRLIVGFSAGGTTDFLCRLIADRAKNLLGQGVVVENKPGASGAIAADYVSKAAPDGYTLFFSTAGALAINPSLRNDLPYDPIKGFTPILPVARNTVVFAINPSLGITTAKDMVARAKEKPGSLTVAVTGIGAISHLTIEMLQVAAKIKLQVVPYRGAGAAIADLVGGQVNGLSAEVPVLISQIKAGKARILAVASQNRSDAMPDVPTFAELGYPDVVADNWSGLLAPPKTPPEVVAKLNAAVNAVVKDPDVKHRLADVGIATIGGSADDLTKLITSETARWHKVVAETGMKVGK
jgi:tripartite-type tricarboxylate transporter receptor subunit TctC